eukprot:IDg20418t1
MWPDCLEDHASYMFTLRATGMTARVSFCCQQARALPLRTYIFLLAMIVRSCPAVLPLRSTEVELLCRAHIGQLCSCMKYLHPKRSPYLY